MPQNRPPLPKAPQPTKILFDPFNSSSTGHQRAENRLSGSTSWRDSRTYKLSHQLRDTSGIGGINHLLDLVGAGSENFGKDGRKENGDWEKGAPGLREKGWQDIRGLLAPSKKRASDSTDYDKKCETAPKRLCATSPDFGKIQHTSKTAHDWIANPEVTLDGNSNPSPKTDKPPQMFKTLNLYLNGSTAPLVSDHRLRQLWARHGGEVSIGLGRRTVTHVVLGETLAGGGGLASGKVQKEVSRVAGKGVKYVSAQWVLDSIQHGSRLSEAGYVVQVDKLGGAGQGSVRGLFTTKQ